MAVDTVVSGDGVTICSSGVLHKGVMYAVSEGGAAASRFWECEWDSEITAGVPYGAFDVPTSVVRGMRATNGDSFLRIPSHRVWGRSGGVSRDTFVSRYVRDWCLRNAGVGFRLRRVGAGETQRVSDLFDVVAGGVPYSRQFGLDCCTSALIDAVNCLCGSDMANLVAAAVDGPKFHASMRPLGNILQESGVRCRIEKLPPVAVDAIEKSDANAAFEWLVTNGGGGVYVVQLQSPTGIPHAVAVDMSERVVLDKDQLVTLNLSVGSLWISAGGMYGNARVVTGRQVVEM